MTESTAVQASKKDYPAVKCEFCRRERTGSHYNIWRISTGGVAGLREMFGDPPQANEMNFALFSTSGVHGSYATIEEIERSLQKYGPNPEFLKDETEETLPDDHCLPTLTVTVYHPRIIGVGYGNVDITLDDAPFLKALRQSSWDAVQKIGR